MIVEVEGEVQQNQCIVEWYPGTWFCTQWHQCKINIGENVLYIFKKSVGVEPAVLNLMRIVNLVFIACTGVLHVYYFDLIFRSFKVSPSTSMTSRVSHCC